MGLRLHLPVIVPVLLVASGCAGPETRVRSASEAIRKANLEEGDVREGVERAARRLRDADVAEASLRGYSNETVAALHEAAGTATFYFPDRARFVAAQVASLAEKIRRGSATENDFAGMYKAYLGARMFASAESLRRRFPDARLPSAPEVVVSSAPRGKWRAYDLSDGWKKAELKSLPLERGPRVVMVILTGCHFAEEAMGQLLKDPETSAEFRRLGTLVTLQFDAEGVWKWREHFGFREVYIADKASDFPGFDFNSSPQFYFMKDGEIVRRLEGWDGKASWLAGLQAVSSP